MENLRNERGVALVTALMLTMVALAIILAVLYYISAGTKHSAAYRRYSNVLEATGGGGDFFVKELVPQIFSGTKSSLLVGSYPGLSLNFGAYSSCLMQKVNNPTSKWTPDMCGPKATYSDPKVGPDVVFNLNGLPSQPKFKVFAKVVDTVPGNSDMSGYGSGMLDSGSGVASAGASGSGNISPVHVPALLSIEVAGERETNPLEKARMSILYAY